MHHTIVPASEETMRGFRVYLDYRAAQIVDMAQEYVNIRGVALRFQAFVNQLEARHEQVVMWRDRYHTRSILPDLVFEPSETQTRAYQSDPDRATDVALRALFTATNSAHYDRRRAFGWLPAGFEQPWHVQVAQPILDSLHNDGVTNLLITQERITSAHLA